MSDITSDFVVVGAGPTGCALGVYLARGGASVTLVDAVDAPAGVVGESMLPRAGIVFDELGIDMRGFTIKRGAVFCREGQSARYDFSEAFDPSHTHAWQVERERFDLRCREAALRSGCRLLHAAAQGCDPATGTLTTTRGLVRAGRVIDAGGRSMWLSRKLGLRVGDPSLRNTAVGTRMTGVRMRGADEPGDISICSFEQGWIWIIPFGGGVASVGAVLTPSCTLSGSAEALLAGAIASSPDARARLADATRIAPLRGLQDFTATSTRFYGDGFALCGDAATFIDPVFSSGVLLGMWGARGLARALLGGGLDVWEREYRAAAAVFRAAIECWYDGDFLTVALSPREQQKQYLRRGIVTLLAGDVFDADRPLAREMTARIPILAETIRASGV